MIVKNIISSADEAFEVVVIPYHDFKSLVCIYEEHTIDKKRLVYEGEAKFISEQLANQVVESDNSHILKKLEAPKQNASYITKLEDPKPKFKNYVTGEFDQDTAKSSFETIIKKMNDTKFVLIHIRQTKSYPPEEIL